MALSADTNLVFSAPGTSDYPVKATSQIYMGSAVGLVSGYARALVAGDQFVGFALANKLGLATDGAVYVSVQTSGFVTLAITSLAVTDIGKVVYASADGTFTLTQSTNSPIGTVHRWIATGSGVMRFSEKSAAATIITDSTGGSTTGNTLDDTTTSVKDDLAQLAKHINILYGRI